ncbi:MAG: MBOAT family O-acyltransferase, partial [Acidimicrobiales bacterium]
SNLALLGFFKYFNFAADNYNALVTLLGLEGAAVEGVLRVALPLGISFYTFQSMSYTIDVYRRELAARRSLLDVAVFVAFFPQLVAGPIVRFKQIEDDLEHIDRTDRWRSWDLGWSFFTIGMIKKVLLADTIAAVINPALAEPATLSTTGAWLCMLGYAYQIYFDFSGYSDMAVGLGHLFGIRIPQNFDSPYRALDPSDFWRRWHISLSTCLRDYLYIPLGGNRGGAWATNRNLMITMLLGGLWHGANWTFVVWGGYHGALLVAYRLARRPWDALPAPLRRAAMFLLVSVGWVFFRADNLAVAGELLRAMFGGVAGPIFAGVGLFVPVLAIAAAAAHLGKNSWELRHQWRPAAAVGLAVLFAV